MGDKHKKQIISMKHCKEKGVGGLFSFCGELISIFISYQKVRTTQLFIHYILYMFSCRQLSFSFHFHLFPVTFCLLCHDLFKFTPSSYKINYPVIQRDASTFSTSKININPTSSSPQLHISTLFFQANYFSSILHTRNECSFSL